MSDPLSQNSIIDFHAMPMWQCDFTLCTQSAVRTSGECVLCNRHLCSTHLRPTFHQCPKWEDEEKYDPAAREAEIMEVNRLLATLNKSALAQHATALRNGIKCSIPDQEYDRDTRSSVMGGMNYHMEVRFDDGVTWLARIRRFNATSPPPALRDYIIMSEVATLQFLETTSVPAPRVHGFALEEDTNNKVGAGYILMEKLAGTSFNKSQASADQLKFVTEQLSRISMELFAHPFQSMGSLDKPGCHNIGPFARESLADFNGSEMTLLGPCSSVEEFYRSSINLILDFTTKGEMYTERPVEAYIIHRFLLEIVNQVLPTSTKAGPFFLKHPDDKGVHILVDDMANITGVIDWEWAYTAPIEVAFNSPLLLLPVADFYAGRREISEEEAYFARCLEADGSRELADAVRTGRVRHFFSFCCGYDLEDWTGFLGLFRGLRDALGLDADLEWDQWKAQAIEKYRGDSRLQTLLGWRDDAGGQVTCLKETVGLENQLSFRATII